MEKETYKTENFSSLGGKVGSVLGGLAGSLCEEGVKLLLKVTWFTLSKVVWPLAKKVVTETYLLSRDTILPFSVRTVKKAGKGVYKGVNKLIPDNVSKEKAIVTFDPPKIECEEIKPTNIKVVVFPRKNDPVKCNEREF